MLAWTTNVNLRMVAGWLQQFQASHSDMETFRRDHPSCELFWSEKRLLRNPPEYAPHLPFIRFASPVHVQTTWEGNTTL